ncbi:LacI family DNA-binding transcriptional regulator [Flavitalea flava]
MIRCTKCGQVHAITKSGLARGKQRYYCKDCQIYFTIPAAQQDMAPSPTHIATILDIARALNISKSTVSRALQGHTDIKEETRKAVVQMAKKLDYQPNLLAKSLVNSRSNTIGIIVPEFLTSFFPTVIIGAQQIAGEAGYNVIICQSQESVQTEMANTQVLLASRVDGVIISMTRETSDFDHFRTFGRHGIPIVFFNRICEKINTSRVTVNDYEGAYNAVEHLILNGYKRIAHISGPPKLRVSQNRLKGYLDALKTHKLPTHEKWILHHDLTAENAWDSAKKLLTQKTRPDAIFCINDPAAIQTLLYAKSRGIKVPDELGIVGFSDDPISSVIEPQLTTVKQPVSEMGRTAMRLLLEQIKNGNAPYTPVHTKLPTNLIVRQSSVRKKS